MLYKCFSPRRVELESTRQYIYADCGKCVACCNKRSYELSERVLRELKANANNTALFVTLTYRNEHLPIYSPLDNRIELVNAGTGELKLTDANPKWHSNKDHMFERYEPMDVKGKYYPVPENHPNRECFGHLCYEDLLRFHSLFRQTLHKDFKRRKATCNKSGRAKRKLATYDYIDKHFKSKGLSYEDVKYRYFQTGEYGSDSFRPHYHLILWFGREWNTYQLAYIYEIIHTCWTLGSLDIQAVTSTGVEKYLANYVTSTTGLPEVLTHQSVRPFCTFSKSPAIGAVPIRENEVPQSFSRGAVERTKYNHDTKEHEDVVLPPAFYRRHFPKCVRFSTLSYSHKLSIYSYVWKYFQKKGITHTKEEVMKLRLRDIDFDEEYRIYHSRVDGVFNPFSDKTVMAGAYLPGLTTYEYYRYVNELSEDGIQGTKLDVQHDRQNFIEGFIADENTIPELETLEDWNKVRGLWTYLDKYASLMCYRYCVLYGLTPRAVLDYIQRIYDNLELRSLAEFYKEQEQHNNDINNDYGRFNRKIGK